MMDKFYSLSKISQQLIVLTSALLLYGYLCRLIGLDFFWESKYLGWSFVCVTVIFIMKDRIQLKKAESKKTVSEKVAIGIMLFMLAIQVTLAIVTLQTDAYKTAKAFLLTSKSVSNEVGEVTGVVLVPVGSLSSTSDSHGTVGQADLNFIVKGKSKFMDYDLQLVKEGNSDWTIVNN